MMNPDLMQMMHQQRHQILWAEAEHERAKRELLADRMSRGSAWFATWLQRLRARRRCDAILAAFARGRGFRRAA